MAKTRLTPVDEYIASRPEAVRPMLERVRRIVRKAIPGGEEAISYQMPACRLHGRIVLYYAGWTEHYALYPASQSVATAFKNELEPYELSKGTIRFPLSAPVPAKLIEAIAKFRAREVEERAAAKAAARKKR